MKNKVLYITVPLLMLICSSCNKISENIQRDILIWDTIIFDIPVLSSTETNTPLSKLEMQVNLDEEIRNQVKEFTPANLSAVKLSSLNLALEPVGKDKAGRDSIDVENNFGNLEILRFEIATEGKTDNMATAAISSTGVVGTLAPTIGILPETLRPYLAGTVKHYNVVVKAKKVTTRTMKVAALISYTVTLSK